VRRPAESRESGFTLLELMVAMLLFGIICAIAVAPYRNYQTSQAHVNSTRRLVATLRNAQTRAVAEAVQYRVVIASGGKSWQLSRANGSSWTNVGAAVKPSDTKITIRDASFRQADGSLTSTVVFYPRGSATKGSLVVGRDDRSKVYTVTVEGLTARVSYT